MVVLVAFAGIAFEWRAEMWVLMVWAFVVELVLVSMASMMLVAQWFAFVASPEMNRKKSEKNIIFSSKSSPHAKAAYHSLFVFHFQRRFTLVHIRLICWYFQCRFYRIQWFRWE